MPLVLESFLSIERNRRHRIAALALALNEDFLKGHFFYVVQRSSAFRAPYLDARLDLRFLVHINFSYHDNKCSIKCIKYIK